MLNILRIKENSVLIDKNTDTRVYHLPITQYSILTPSAEPQLNALTKKVDNLLYKMKELRAVGLSSLTLFHHLINREPSGDSAYL